MAKQLLLAAATVSKAHVDENGAVVIEVTPLRTQVRVRGLKLSHEVLAASVADWVGDPVRLHSHRKDQHFLVPAEDFGKKSRHPFVGRVTRSRISDDGDLVLRLALERDKLQEHRYQAAVGNQVSAELVVNHKGENITAIKLTNGVALLTKTRGEVSPEDGGGVTAVIAASKDVCSSCGKQHTGGTVTEKNKGKGGEPAVEPLQKQLEGISATALLTLAKGAGIEGLQLKPEDPPEDTDEVKAAKEKAAAYDKLIAAQGQKLAEKLAEIGVIAKEKIEEFAKRPIEILEELVSAHAKGLEAGGGKKGGKPATAGLQASEAGKAPRNTSISPEGDGDGKDNGHRGAALTLAQIKKRRQELNA
ncbi:MAG: hypothetical protein OXH75_17665 [Acidobacteria bacterium]|nr:hypothetical protein [Acidobacteriota bacterium]